MWRKYFLFVFSLLFIAGNLLSASLTDSVPCSSKTYIILVLCDITIIALSLFVRTSFRHFPLVIAFCLGQSGFCIRETFRQDESLYFHEEGAVCIEGIVSDLGVSSSGKPFAEIALDTSKSRRRESSVLYALPPSVQPRIGDTISATVHARRVADFTPGFDYVTHMARQGIFYTCTPSRQGTIELNSPNRIPLRLYPAAARQRFSARIDSIFPDEADRDARSVIKALSYGYQDEVPAEIMNAFRTSGALHLLALSGMHLVMIYSILAFILSLFGRSPAARKVQSALLLLILWSYTIFTGCGISILRAMLMITVYEAGSLLDRPRHPLNALGLSAIIIAIVNPYAPCGLSFQLSYAAMTAIFLIHPILRTVISTRNRLIRSSADACSITISCQLLTAPVIWLHFRTFAHFSLLVNIICSPITSLGMMLTPAALLTADIPWLRFIPQALTATIDLLIRVNEIIAKI